MTVDAFLSDLGIGNRLTLLDDELLANLHAIQLRHGLAPSPSLASGDFVDTLKQGDKIEKVTIKGDTTTLFAETKVKDKVAAWNSVLDSKKGS